MVPDVVGAEDRRIPPEILYKYMTAERTLMCLPEVGDGTLRATQPAALNDPFECAVQMGTVTPEDDDQQLAKALSDIHGTSKVTESDVRREKFYSGSFYLRNLLTRQLSQRFGIVSFSTDPRHPLMWSHYTRDGSGFVIGYSANRLISLASGWGWLRQVVYRADMERWFGYGVLNDPKENLLAALSLKSDHWKYEDEWRLIAELKDTIGTGHSDDLGQPINLVRVPNEAVVEVFHTERTPRETVELIQARLQDPNNRYGTQSLTRLLMAVTRYGYEDEDPENPRGMIMVH